MKINIGWSFLELKFPHTSVNKVQSRGDMVALEGIEIGGGVERIRLFPT